MNMLLNYYFICKNVEVRSLPEDNTKTSRQHKNPEETDGTIHNIGVMLFCVCFVSYFRHFIDFCVAKIDIYFCRDLAPKDKTGYSDPYVSVTCLDETKFTTVCFYHLQF